MQRWRTRRAVAILEPPVAEPEVQLNASHSATLGSSSRSPARTSMSKSTPPKKTGKQKSSRKSVGVNQTCTDDWEFDRFGCWGRCRQWVCAFSSYLADRPRTPTASGSKMDRRRSSRNIWGAGSRTVAHAAGLVSALPCGWLSKLLIAAVMGVIVLERLFVNERPAPIPRTQSLFPAPASAPASTHSSDLVQQTPNELASTWRAQTGTFREPVPPHISHLNSCPADSEPTSSVYMHSQNGDVFVGSCSKRQTNKQVKTLGEEQDLPPHPRGNSAKPMVVLLAPCLLEEFTQLVEVYTPWARWYYRKATQVLLEVRHKDEKPIVFREMASITQKKLFQYLSPCVIPLFGPLTSVTYNRYLTQDTGMVWVVLDTKTFASANAAQKIIRPTMLRIAQAFRSKFLMGYVDMSKALTRRWLMSELSITQSDIPAIVVQMKPGSSPNFVYRGLMTDSHITQFLNNALDGCLGYQHPLQNFGGLAKVERLETCDMLAGGGVAQCKEC